MPQRPQTFKPFAKAKTFDARPSARERGYDTQWEAVRLQALRRDCYLCVICKAEGLLPDDVFSASARCIEAVSTSAPSAASTVSDLDRILDAERQRRAVQLRRDEQFGRVDQVLRELRNAAERFGQYSPRSVLQEVTFMPAVASDRDPQVMQIFWPRRAARFVEFMQTLDKHSLLPILPEPQRAILWKIFERVQGELKRLELLTESALFTRLATAIAAAGRSPFEHAIIDEAQDLGIAQLRFFAALGAERENALFFAGDLGQRIFQQPFSWKALGIDIRGRSRTLRVNYRTSHQIRSQADRLLGPEVTDVDGNTEQRNDTVSVFNGPPPAIRAFETEADEIQTAADWLSSLTKSGLSPSECGVFVRSAAQLNRAQSAAAKAALPYQILDDSVQTTGDKLSICTMHLAKGLEFRAVAVMACDDEVIPLQERIESVGDTADLQEIYDTERHLLYVACTRARDHLLITSTDPASEFLDDLQGKAGR